MSLQVHHKHLQTKRYQTKFTFSKSNNFFAEELLIFIFNKNSFREVKSPRDVLIKL